MTIQQARENLNEIRKARGNLSDWFVLGYEEFSHASGSFKATFSFSYWLNGQIYKNGRGVTVQDAYGALVQELGESPAAIDADAQLQTA